MFMVDLVSVAWARGVWGLPHYGRLLWHTGMNFVVFRQQHYKRESHNWLIERTLGQIVMVISAMNVYDLLIDWSIIECVIDLMHVWLMHLCLKHLCLSKFDWLFVSWRIGMIWMSWLNGWLIVCFSWGMMEGDVERLFLFGIVAKRSFAWIVLVVDHTGCGMVLNIPFTNIISILPS